MRYLVLGDTHADINHVEYAFARAEKMECPKIMQVGDFGYWPRVNGGRQFLASVRDLVAKTGIEFYWLAGNHEDWDSLDKTYSFLSVMHPFDVVEGVTHCPTGMAWEEDGVKFLTVGGASSIDAAGREEGFDWFPQEVITETDVMRCEGVAQALGGVDVIFSHDVPMTVDIASHMHSHGRRIFSFDAGTLGNRERLQRIVNACQPKVLIHGHWHLDYTDRIGRLKVVGLHCNFKVNRSWTVLDTEDFNS